MTIQQVLYVLEIARRSSVSQAAQRLFISQSALSQQLKRLEEELGYPMFRRAASGLRLTEEGRRFCQQAEPLLQQWRDFTQAVQKTPGRETIRLRLGLGSRVYSNGLFSRIVDYFDERPEIEVTFVTEAGQDVVSALREGSLDLALDRLPDQEENSPAQDLFACPLIRERQCVLLSPRDPRALRSALSFRDLEGCVMISGLENSAEDRSMRSAIQKHHISVKRVYRSDGIETSMRLVRDGKGISLGPESFADYFGVAAVPLEPETWVDLQFICQRESLQRPEIPSFRDYLLALCQQKQD